MIQRIQSFYLVLVVVCVLLMFIFPIAIYTVDIAGSPTKIALNLLADSKAEINQSTFVNVIYLPIIVAVLGAFILFIIFKYKNRVLQVKLLAFALLINLAYIALVFFLATKNFSVALKETFNLPELVNPAYSIGTYIPLVSIALLMLAQNAIKKDEKKVRSANRIR